MGLKKIYKGGKEKTLNWSAANELVANDGWSWTKESTTSLKAIKKSVYPKKAKVEVKAEIKKEDIGIININKEK
tara:strand:- start:504 stop:725 length:222 start_codon:yes stop_codon:yes gene_type:complete